MKIHLFATENLYTFEFLKFLERNFDITSSLFVFRGNIGLSFNYPDAIKDRIIVSKSNFSFLKNVMPLIRKSEKFYFHQLPYGPSLLLWNLHQRLLAKSVWIIWGGDVYIHARRKDSAKRTFFELLRRRLIKYIPVVASFIPGDFEIVKEIYGSKARYFPSAYPIPLDFMSIDLQPRQSETPGSINILLGNSGNEINNHADALEMLSFLKDSDIKIYCPLPYGGEKEYINSVVAKGSEIFGDRFRPLLNFLDKKDYLCLLSEMDIAVMNHNRQQGLGNILPLMYFGKKVYLRTETTSYSFLKDLGCHVFDIETIREDRSSFLKIDQDTLIKNRDIITSLLSEKRYISLWTKLLS